MPPKKKAAKKAVAKMAVAAPPLGQPVPEGTQGDFGLGHEIAVLLPLVEMDPPSWNLAPFSGKKTRCPKCGLGGGADDVSIGAYFHDLVPVGAVCYRMHVSRNMPLFNEIGFPEHLDRRCPVCHYEWVEGLAPEPLQDL